MHFRAYAMRPDHELDLLEGATLIARLAHPALQLATVSGALNDLAEPLTGLGLERLPVFAQAKALSDYLYLACGFRGNAEGYHEPENSFIDAVLERRLGIPISLAVVYIEVARRVGVRARGVGFPGHFLVRIDDGDDTVIVDPFFAGEILDRRALEGLLRRASPRGNLVDEMLAPAGVRPILARMLINLKSIYGARGEGGKLLAVLDHLVDLIPDALDEIRDRGFLCARLGAPRAALSDLKSYVDALPHAGDAAEIRMVIATLEAGLARAN